MSIEASLAMAAATLTGKATKRSRKVEWSAPKLEDFNEGAVLAFDQTFSKTGWVFAQSDGYQGPTVVEKGFISVPPIPDTLRFFDLLQRTEWMGEQILEVLTRFHKSPWSVDGFDVVHEMPILQGMRVESSLLGAVKVWEACKVLDRPQPTILSKTRVAGLLCPPGDRKGKDAIKRGLMPYIDTTKGWNEHNRDAAGLAITRLHDKEGD